MTENYYLLNKSIAIAQKVKDNTPNGPVYQIISEILTLAIEKKNELKKEKESQSILSKMENNSNSIYNNELELLFKEASCLASGLRPWRALGFCTAITPESFPIDKICRNLQKDQKEDIYFVYNNCRDIGDINE